MTLNSRYFNAVTSYSKWEQVHKKTCGNGKSEAGSGSRRKLVTSGTDSVPESKLNTKICVDFVDRQPGWLSFILLATNPDNMDETIPDMWT